MTVYTLVMKITNLDERILYVEDALFDEAERSLKSRGCKFASSEEIARLIASKGPKKHGYTSDAFIYIPKGKSDVRVFATKNSPLIENAEKVVSLHRGYAQYHLTPEQLERLLAHAVEIIEIRYEPILVVNFNKTPFIRHLLGDATDEYAAFLEKNGIRQVRVDPFAKTAPWLQVHKGAIAEEICFCGSNPINLSGPPEIFGIHDGVGLYKSNFFGIKNKE